MAVFSALALLVHVLQVNAAPRLVPEHGTIVGREDVSETTYDFIVAGGGISGLTVADRLTEDPDVTVLVIEAGPFDRGEDSVLIPGAFFPVPYLWLPLQSAPQKALNGRSFNVPVGRVVGGGSVVNGMVFFRGGREEYADWAKLGAKGWDWDSLFPYFIKSENHTAPDQTFAETANISYAASAHGHDGPVQVSFPNFYFGGSENWWNAAISSGMKPTGDPNAGRTTGVTYFPTVSDFTTRTRSHARLNHYERVKERRPNYHILAEHTVSHVIFEGKKAVGVTYLPSAGGDVAIASAKKEVLLAAGAVHTPQILQLSGIGPREVLEEVGIEVVADLPGVGQNFHDQPSIIIPYEVSNNIQPNVGTLNADKEYDAEQRKRYDESREGPYVITRGLSTNLALPTLCDVTSRCKDIVTAARANDPAKYLPEGTHPTVLEGYKTQREILLQEIESEDTPVAMIHWDTANSVRLYFLRPLSRGSIKVNTTNPLATPVIDFQTLFDPIDFDMVVASFLKNRDIMNQPTMKILGAKEASPYSDDITDPEELKKILAGAAEPSSAHECCTAAMMPKKLGGVVDPNMKVYDVEGLRVIDVSYWPFVLTAAPTATTYASGEKIADAIKKEYGMGGNRGSSGFQR